MYRAAGEGKSLRIVKVDGNVPVAIDVNDQGFCDFLTWAATDGDTDIQTRFGLPARARYFCDETAFNEFYKSAGDLLVVEPSAAENGHKHSLQTGQTKQFGKTGRFVNLYKLFATPGSLGRDTSGGVIATECKTWVTEKLLAHLDAQLIDEDTCIRRFSTWPIDRCFVYIDVSDFSQYLPGQQCLIINSLVRTVHSLLESRIPEIREAASSREASLCIGDGYIYVFRNSSNATFFATALAYLIELLAARNSLPVPYHFRMSVHSGLVYSFWDPGRNGWNYIGDGINGGQRVLGAIGKDVDDVLFISADIKRSLTAEFNGSKVYSMLLNSLQNKGRRNDKHGNPWRVYEVNHTNTITSCFSDILTGKAW